MTSVQEKNLKCSYPTPCVMMDNHALSSDGRGGIVALDNRVWIYDVSRFFHMGFALRPSPHPEAGKRGVFLNFCPFCGSNLNEWLDACQADMDGFKSRDRKKRKLNSDRYKGCRNRKGVRYTFFEDVSDESGGSPRERASSIVRRLRADGRKAFFETHPDGHVRIFVETSSDMLEVESD